MKKLITYIALALLTATTATVQAKDKDRDKHNDHDRNHYESSNRRHYESNNRDHRDYRSGYRGHQDRTRSIFIIEGGRPVERVVYIDSDGRYYRRVDGRRSYVRERYYESYPSRQYTTSGKRRFTFSF